MPPNQGNLFKCSGHLSGFESLYERAYLIVAHWYVDVAALSICFEPDLRVLWSKGANSLASTAFYLY